MLNFFKPGLLFGTREYVKTEDKKNVRTLLKVFPAIKFCNNSGWCEWRTDVRCINMRSSSSFSTITLTAGATGSSTQKWACYLVEFKTQRMYHYAHTLSIRLVYTEKWYVMYPLQTCYNNPKTSSDVAIWRQWAGWMGIRPHLEGDLPNWPLLRPQMWIQGPVCLRFNQTGSLRL